MAFLGFSAVCAAATADSLAGYLEFNRECIYDGQWWRLITAHVSHFGALHLGANLFYLGMLVALMRRWHVKGWIDYVLSAALVVTLALLLEPDGLDRYRGLSAILYGLTVWCCLVLAPMGRPYLYAGPALIVALIALELLGYSLPRDWGSSKVPVYPAAHLYAVLAAFVWYAVRFQIVFRYLRSCSKSKSETK